MQKQPPALINEDTLNGLLGRAITDFGATSLAALVVIGDRLGLYRELAQSGALTAAELATKTGTHERYVREWLNAHAASGYLQYLADSGRYQLSPEQAMLFAQEDSPAFIIMAKACPNSQFTGFDYHVESIAAARGHARDAGVTNVSFEIGTADNYGPKDGGHTYDFVPVFDALHDMGNPAAASRHVLQTLSPGGTWMIVEPYAGDRIEENLNPLGRAYHAASTLLCTPCSLSQEGRMGLGAPVNLILELVLKRRRRDWNGNAGWACRLA